MIVVADVCAAIAAALPDKTDAVGSSARCGKLEAPASGVYFEIWSGAKRLARTQRLSLEVGRQPGRYRVRGVNVVGAGPPASAR